MARLFLLLIVALALAPGTWWRAPYRAGHVDDRSILSVEPLRFPHARFGEVAIAGAWRLSSTNRHFGGYSALLPMDDGTLLAVADGGQMMRLAPPDTPPRSATFDNFAAATEEMDKHLVDAEAVTRDPGSRTMWAAYEVTNKIVRYRPDRTASGFVRPAEMRGWPANTGPESIVRLGDGRFVVLSEGSPRWFAADLPALLFAGDPVERSAARRFRFRPPESYRPVDTALLPDGRILILLRRLVLGLPPRFEAKLVVADPREIRAGEQWRGREIAHLAEPVPMDNYEGVAVAPGPDGALVLWLISDDNKATFQRTLLLKLLWRPSDSHEKARELPRAPS
jgi:hypothetical protein